jgi:hypothetical protein
MRPILAFGAVAMLMATVAHANGDSNRASESPMFEVPGHTGNAPAPGDRSVLRRFKDFVELKVSTSGLDPAMPYTVWAAVFNNPQYCATQPCSPADLPFMPGHNPNVRASLVNVTGGAADASGNGEFVGRLHNTHSGIAGAAALLFGPGLLDTRRADFLIVVRRHGDPATPSTDLATLFQSISSYTGGCAADPSDCDDQQASIHVAP